MSEIKRPWRNADTLKESVELLRNKAQSIVGEPCDAWYGEELDAILEAHNDE